MDYFFTQALTDICEHSLVYPDRSLRCMIIVNPVAGGFTIKSKWKNCTRALEIYHKKALANPKRPVHKAILMNLTKGKGSAFEFTEEFIRKAAHDPVPFYLIISAGGDGTHREVLLSVFNAPDEVRSNMAVLRLPMGTGNDGPDASCMEKALDLLINPVHVEFASAVQLTTASGGSASQRGSFLAFNILSLGLDAYVTHKTNSMKEKKPGNYYKFWVDMAALFYERYYKVDYVDVRALDDNNNEIISFNEKLLLMAMGASGHRTYGAQQHILPDERNVCCIKKMSLFGKLVIKGKVLKGTHTENRGVIIFKARRLEFTCIQPILVQTDGEGTLLQPNDFPAVLELTTPVIPLLKIQSPVMLK